MPPTFDPTIDGADDLPGPSVEMMRVGVSLLSAVCGDGLVGIDESCDDGNTIPGDGCNATCQEVEICFTCVGDPSACTRIATCTDGDGCCPAGCGSTTDDDCPRAVSCKQAKAKAAGKKAADLLKAFGKNEKEPNVPRLAQDISKAQSKFTKKYTREESKGGCQTIDDADALEAKVDAFVWDAIDEVCLP
jgi:cysteine-rich repeat protein